MKITPLPYVILVSALAALQPAPAAAEQVRFRFVPTDPCGNMTQVPAGPNGALGEQLTGFGLRPQPYGRVFRPNQLVTFRHPYNGRNVTVPLTLPQGTPRLEHRADSIVFNYGTYVVEARFFTDGSVETVYNSGFLRPLVVE
jgi:hypothetical protein